MSLELLVLDSSEDEVVDSSEDVVLSLALDAVVPPLVVSVPSLVVDDVVSPLVLDRVVSAAVPPEFPVDPVLVVAPPVWESAVEADAVGPESSLAPAVVPEPVSPWDPAGAGSSKQPVLMRATRPRGKVRNFMG